MDWGKAPAAGTIALIVVTALIGMLMGVFGKRAAEYVLELILRPFRSIKEAVYRWIAPRNPFSISLRTYKKHISRSNLTRIENPVGPNLDVPLEHAFAPLRLITSDMQESVELFSHAATSYRCIVLGGPGTGKTTLMKSLVTNIIKGRCHEDLNDLIPVFIVLRNLAKKEHSVEQAIVSAFAEYHFPGAENFISSALSQGKMLIVLDGLDEVGASREFVAGQILNFCEYDEQREHKNRLIVTCRENSYRTKDLQSAIPEIVRVEPFANHHIRVFLQGWPGHKGRLPMNLYTMIQADPQIRDICRNPLLLTILTGLYLDLDRFELPTSRDRFYNSAIEELLVHRPARRQFNQKFDADDKRQILERVSLDRLETAALQEDPEEFTREAIQRKAEEVMRQEKLDLRELIKELVEINGIIKPTAEGNFTCAHRTIQEYLAAREARRKRDKDEVVEKFGSRPDLIEVLYFYCGLIDNLPSLTFIVETFVSQNRWLEAGRCILHMKETIEEKLIAKVAGELHKRIKPDAEFKSELEVLSSLAQRREPEFETARKLFSETIDDLAEGYGEKGALAFESALAASPEAAMKVIPGLLEHPSHRWRTVAMQLLRDIGTDESLDHLVKLLNAEDQFIRRETGKILAEMLKSRNKDLRERVLFLPEREDATIWPVEAYFPGRLAIPIAEALGDSNEETNNSAINCAVRAVRARKADPTSDERHFIKQWCRLPRDLRLRRFRELSGKRLVLIAVLLPLMVFILYFSLRILGYFQDKVFMISLMPIQIHTVELQKLRNIRDNAEIIVQEIERRFPPNASGWARILPWNWSVEPVIPDDNTKAFYSMNQSLTSTRVSKLGRVDFSQYTDMISDLGLIEKVSNLQVAIMDVEQLSVKVQGDMRIIVQDEGWTHLLLPFMLIINAYTFRVHLIDKYRYDSDRDRSSIIKNLFLLNQGLISIVALMYLSLVLLDTNGITGWMMLLFPLAGIIFFCGLAGYQLQGMEWPKNPLIDVVDDIVPPQEPKKTKYNVQVFSSRTRKKNTTRRQD